MEKIKLNRCEVCGRFGVRIAQFSPDAGWLYFCLFRHFKKYYKKFVYRALPAFYIKNGKVVDR